MPAGAGWRVKLFRVQLFRRGVDTSHWAPAPLAGPEQCPCPLTTHLPLIDPSQPLLKCLVWIWRCIKVFFFHLFSARLFRSVDCVASEISDILQDLLCIYFAQQSHNLFFVLSWSPHPFKEFFYGIIHTHFAHNVLQYSVQHTALHSFPFCLSAVCQCGWTPTDPITSVSSVLTSEMIAWSLLFFFSFFHPTSPCCAFLTPSSSDRWLLYQVKTWPMDHFWQEQSAL